MGIINVLSNDLINKIAAGEVVERPASVVKELVENSIDAGATEITVKINKGGLELIEVIDNGSGMDSSDAELAFVQHATSKINKEEDLNKILSMGFRGEALASIASVSEAKIHTYDGKSEPILASQENSSIKISSGSGRKQGTTVTVRNIFIKIPARRKFLKSESTEYRHIQDMLINLALSNPFIAFTLVKDGKESFKYGKTKQLEDRITQIFPQVENKLIKIIYDSPDLKLSGFIGHPSTSRRDRTQQYIFINGRPIKDHLISKAVKEGYRTSLMNDKHPIFFINININPELVDVNIHPRKQEVKFSNSGIIFQAAKNATSKALEIELQSNLNKSFTGPSSTTMIPEITNRPQTANKPSQSWGQYKQPSQKSQIPKSLEFTKTILQEPSLLETEHDDRDEGNNKESLNELQINTGNILQVLNTYLVIQQDTSVMIIDQHAADERIKFEKLSKQLENDSIQTQSLLIPEELSLAANELEIVKEYLSQLAKLGFVIEPLSNNALQLTEIPELLASSNYLDTLKAIIADLNSSSGNSTEAFDSALNDIIATMACHGSIRAGRKVHQSEAEKIITDLFECKLPYSCPHGRPIIWELSQYDIEKQFKRKL